MTRSRVFPAVVLAIALAALGASVAWAVTRHGGWRMGAHHANHSGWMTGYSPSGASAPVRSPADARQNAQAFADRLDLKADEVLQFKRNYYVRLVDSRGNGATEVLVDPPTGVVSLEYGPAMMWNTRYGMSSRRGAGGMMRGGNGGMMRNGNDGMMRNGGMMSGSVTGGAATPPSSLADAREIAQRWLDDNRSDARVESGGDRFPGYYTFETLRGGRIDGMISVNAATGAVWPHWWHGAFVGEA